MDFIVPVCLPDSKPIATIVLRIDPERFLYPLIMEWPTPSKTSETLLVKRDSDFVVFVNKLRHSNNPPLTLKYPLSETKIPAVKAILGFTGVTEGIDYRGVPVFSFISFLRSAINQKF